MRALGVDVGVRRGLDLVLLEGSTVTISHRHVALKDLAPLFAAAKADVVAIDSPPAWALTGRSRQAERDLARLGIHAYAAPTSARGESHPFYEWMRVGFEVFRVAAESGFPRYESGAVHGTAIEVFPHASAVALAGCLPPRGVGKHAWRSAVLRAHGVEAGGLRSPDLIDAALAALTGLCALEGRRVPVGDPSEGIILLPIATLPTTRYERCRESTVLSHPEGGAMRFETMAIHVGQDPEPAFGAVNVPIFQTSTYAQEGVGKPKRHDYARTGNPTRDALEAVLAALEGGAHGLCFASGMAAETTLLLAVLRPGDHVILGDDVYGGTYRLLARLLTDWGVEFDTVDLTERRALEGALRDRTRVVWIESPTNPFLKVVDIAEATEIARGAGALCVVDNTFATPYLQRPLELGADVAVHSVTKYLGGHSDLVGGALVLADHDLAGRLRFLQNAVGAVPGPMDCYLALRGVKTLAVRMEAHCRGARRVAEFLTAHDAVSRVHYPGLADHPQHEVAKRQMRDFGGMVSFEMPGPDEAIRVAEGTELFFLGESLGGVESLIELPGPMTHASVAGSALEVPPTLVRLSVGIEHPEDLVADLARALDSA